jgi:NAD+ synthase (glutamine-hydrolysing)
MRTFRLAMSQMNSTVGDLEGNTQKIFTFIDEARSLNADLVAFPEMAIPGYPPEDLLFKPSFVKDNMNKMREVVEYSHGIAVVVGFVDSESGIRNAAAVACDGRLVGVYYKIYLPNYGVFDEKRYFSAGSHCPVFVINGVGIGISICEDIWYALGPTTVQREFGAELIVNINASPYHAGKADFRNEMLASRALDNQVHLSYTNMVGGQDELVFDGGSMLFDDTGKLVARGRQFEEDLVVADLCIQESAHTLHRAPKLPKNKRDILSGIGVGYEVRVSDYAPVSARPLLTPKVVVPLDFVSEVYAALILGTRDYVKKCGFDKVVIGLSGGIDSSITAAIAVEALGRENVVGVTMPSRYSSTGSIVDSQILARQLGIELITISIEEPFTAFLNALDTSLRAPVGDNGPDMSEENLQARIRCNILMAMSNKFGWLVLTTGNKSEIATGYTTLYGDMAGGFAVIKDVPKTLVYRLAAYYNELRPRNVIPNSILEKPPSAELRPNQMDVDALPVYETLDSILKAYVEEDQSLEDILSMGFDRDLVVKVMGLVDHSEYKRRQAPPGIKITSRAFGRDRRLPIVNHYRQL